MSYILKLSFRYGVYFTFQILIVKTPIFETHKNKLQQMVENSTETI